MVKATSFGFGDWWKGLCKCLADMRSVIFEKKVVSEANGHEIRYFLENVPKIGNFDKIAEHMSDNLAKMLNEQK